MSSSVSQYCFEKITKCNVAGLDLDYTFDIIPDSPAATEAGYTASDRANAEVWYSPVIDGDKFYYTGFTGLNTAPTHKSGILVCRYLSDGSLVYAVNCKHYGLDIAPNFFGDTAIMPRVRPVILGNAMYIVNSPYSNIGPQLYKVDKRDGSLIWAAAYYTPNGAPTYITERGDYSQFKGSNMRLGDLNPVVFQNKGRTFILTGVSSGQNFLNIGVAQGTYPLYTDQGFLFCIEDLGQTSQLVWRTPVCAPELKIGDILTKGGDHTFDPFPPNQDYVVIVSISDPTNYLLQPYFIENPPSPGKPNTGPVAANVSFTKTTIIDASLVQPLWNLPDLAIYQDANRITSHTLDELLAAWTAEQAALPADGVARHVIWSYIDEITMSQAQSQDGNNDIMYFKALYNGQTVSNKADAQGLNYWGNSVWGGLPIVDMKRGLVYFGTGQAHSMPMSEILYYNTPEHDYIKLKIPVVNMIDRYVAGTASLAAVNDVKHIFTEILRADALDVYPKSPRGRLSYSDGIVAARLSDGVIAFAVRTLSWDNFTFLNTAPADIYPINSADADVSSGQLLYEDECHTLLSTSTKGGLVATLDITHWNKRISFDHMNLAEVGIFFKPMIFAGPSSALGGSNFQVVQSGETLTAVQGNIAWFSGARASDGTLERAISADGRVFQVDNSFVQCVNVKTGKILWETALENRAVEQVTIHNGLIFCQDLNGSCYVLSGKSGQLIWKADGSHWGMNGGNVGPQITKQGQVLWMNNYIVAGQGHFGPHGVSLRVNSDLLINKCTTVCSMLNKKNFISWDVYPKHSFPNPFAMPVNNLIVTHTWSRKHHRTSVTGVHTITVPPSTVTVQFVVDNFDPCAKLVTFVPDVQHDISYLNLKLINTKTYRLEFNKIVNNQPVKYKVWLRRD